MPSKSFKRRTLFALATAVAALGLVNQVNAVDVDKLLQADLDLGLCNGINLREATIQDLQYAFENNLLSSHQLTKCYLDRIKVMNPHLNAIIEVNKDALEIAENLDKERKQKGSRGPLHGIPILVKDNVATRDGMETGAGSLALVGAKPKQDATVVAKLRKAGAIILGKSNMSEWANFRSMSSVEAWSARGGQTHDAYILSAQPSGSSSGSAVAVAANLAVAALGTETDGSIIAPAARNAAVGLKPTVGVTSRAGVIPISSTQDSIGPITRTVTDAAIIMNAIAGFDPRDDATKKMKKVPDYGRSLRRDGLKNVRIGIPRKPYWTAKSIKSQLFQLENALTLMRNLGARIRDNSEIPTADKLNSDEWVWFDSELNVCLTEFKVGLNNYLQNELESSPVRSLADIIEFNEKHKDKEMKLFGQDLLIRSQATKGLEDPEYLKSRSTNLKLAREMGIDKVLNDYNLDVLVVPSEPLAPETTPAAVAGYPMITLPFGYDEDGLPLGISFIGRAYSEQLLLKIGYAFEQATRARVPPNYKKCCSKVDI
ncbi:uncharacterized protein VTP21DRAFT_3671 [Calcarisporiella thermophila]|uniref:uncharacterized protein n=1 Tax=Calcarisporiella thermophila TaxID=911321 RepID=UPI0037443DD4